MNIWWKRILSGILVFCLSLALIPAVATKAEAASTVKLSEMLARAEAMVNYKWTPKEDIYTWQNYAYKYEDGTTAYIKENGQIKYIFKAGKPVKGIPFSMFVEGLVSFDEYKKLASSNKSATKACWAVDGHPDRTGPIYGSCCATFVCEVLGGRFVENGKYRYRGVNTIESSGLGKIITDARIEDIKPGDAIYNQEKSHIAWVGAVTDTKIVLYEQTMPAARRFEIDISKKQGSDYLHHMGSDYIYIIRSYDLDPNPFTDVKPGDYFYKPVLWALDEGITKGTSAITFAPNSNCTRAQVVTFLWRMAGKPKPGTSFCSFRDIPTSGDTRTAILWAVNRGITKGTSDTAFSPNASCTRQQVVVFLWRMAGKPKPGITSCSFTDIPASGETRTAILWAVNKGITSGTTASTFSPNSTCTRGQIVTFLYRARNYINY